MAVFSTHDCPKAYLKAYLLNYNLLYILVIIDISKHNMIMSIISIDRQDFINDISYVSFIFSLLQSKRMKKKYDYDAVNFKGIKKNTHHVSLAAMWNNYGCACFGFIASKKVGGAVERNHAKRRLKEAVRLICINSIAKAIQNNHCNKLLSHCILQNTLNSSGNAITSKHLASQNAISAPASSQQPTRSNGPARPIASTMPRVSPNLSRNNLSIKHQNRLQNMKNCPLFIKNENFYTSLRQSSLSTESLPPQLSCSFPQNIYQTQNISHTNNDHERILPLRSVSYVLIANAATYSIDWPILVRDVCCSINAINNIYYVPNNRVKKY